MVSNIDAVSKSIDRTAQEAESIEHSTEKIGGLTRGLSETVGLFKLADVAPVSRYADGSASRKPVTTSHSSVVKMLVN